MIEIERAPGCELLGAGVTAFQDCRHDLLLAGRFALVNHGDEGNGVVGGYICRTITTVIVAMGSRRTGVYTRSVLILNAVIPRSFISQALVPRGWGLNPGSSSVFALNTALNTGIAKGGAVAHDRGEQFQIGGRTNAIAEEMRASAAGPVRGAP